MSTNFANSNEGLTNDSQGSVPKKEKPQKVKKAKKSKKTLKTIIIIVVILFVLFIVACLLNYSATKDLYKVSLEAKDNFLAAQVSVENQNFEQATADLKLANENFKKADELSDKLWEFKLIPYVRKQFIAVDNLIVIGIQLSSALSKLTELGDDLLAIMEEDGEVAFGDITEEQKRQILEQLYMSPPDLQGVKAEVDLAALAFDQIPDTGLMKQLKEAIDPIKNQFPEIKQLIDRAVPVIQVLPSMAGYPSEKTYLFLMQNNAELRPTGGFIGTYGIVKLKNAEIKEFMTDNIYNLDNPAVDFLHETPPWQYNKYMGSTQWLMRDSNWSVDFSEAAEQALWFYDKENGPEKDINGVIAVTPELIKSLIELTGPITVHGITFTPENFVEIIQYEVEQAFVAKGISLEERKAIIGEIGEKLVEELLALPKDKWQDLWAVYVQNVTSKHLFTYFRDLELQQVAEEENWAGNVQETDSDYLFINDCNLASLKSDPGVIRTHTYNVTKNGDGDYIANLTIHYKNEGSFNWKSTRYRTYTRILVPEGSELISFSGVMENDKLHGGKPGEVETSNQWGKTVFGAFISIEPSEEGEMSFQYKLPKNVFDNYSLTIQKQGGTSAHNVNLNLDFGKDISNINGLDNYKKINNNSLTWQGILDQDINILF